MGLFGGDKKTYSTTSLEQTDTSVAAAGDVGLLQGAGATHADNSLLITGSNQGEVIFNQFPEQVASSVKELVSTVDRAVSQTSAAQLASTQALGTKLQELSLGEASVIPKIALYGLVAFGIAIVAKRLIK